MVPSISTGMTKSGLFTGWQENKESTQYIIHLETTLARVYPNTIINNS